MSAIPGGSRLAAARAEDLVLIAWAGHGLAGPDGQFYLIPSDVPVGAAPTDPGFLARAVAASELSRWLQPIGASEMALVLDTCYSASAVEQQDFKPGPFSDRRFGQLAYDKGVRVLAAAQSRDVAIESQQIGHGLLTYALVVEGLRAGRAFGSNDRLSLGDWLRYGVNRVPALDREIRSGRLVATNAARSLDVKRPEALTQRPSLVDFARVTSAVPFVIR